MREIRLSGSEGGAGQSNAPSLPLCLFAVEANRAYLIKLGGTAAAALTISGRPQAAPSAWKANSFNLVGFVVSPVSPPSFSQFLAGDPALAGQALYRLSAVGHWELVTAPQTTAMRDGEAFWLYCNGASSFVGPLRAAPEVGPELDFGALLDQVRFTVRNESTISRTVAFALADVPPANVLLYSKFDPAQNDFVWVPISDLPVVELAPRASCTIQLGVRRQNLTADFATLLLVTDQYGSLVRLPLTMGK
jgi:hypothetical protein